MKIIRHYGATVIALSSLLIIGLYFIIFWSVRWRRPPIIMAPSGPIKVIPQERGGMYIPKNRHIHDALLVHKKSYEKANKTQVILGSFTHEKQAQKALLHLIALMPDIFQNQTPVIEKRDDEHYQIIALLSPVERQKVCQQIEGCWDEDL